MAIADVVNAMSSHRPYHPALGIDKALAEINAQRGILYDLDVVNACSNLSRRGDSSSKQSTPKEAIWHTKE